MWISAGHSPDSFWHQTPRSFQVAMAGDRKRLEREAQDRFILAYETAALVATAQAGKLEKLEHYIKKDAEPVVTPQAALAVITAMGGGTMKVRRITRGER